MSEKQHKDSAMPKLDVTARLVKPKGNLLGFASVTFNDSFVVDGFSIVQGKDGIFAGMPSRPDDRAQNGYRETAKPITAAFRKALNEAIGEAYHQQVAKIHEQAKAHANTAPKPKLSQQLAEGKAKAAEHNAALSAPKKDIAKAI